MTADVVTCFLRNEGEVLLARYPADSVLAGGRWSAITTSVGQGESPEAAAWRALDAQVGVGGDAATLVRSGAAVSVTVDGDDLLVHPLLFDVATRGPDPDGPHEDTEWVSPTAIGRRETPPGLWRAYERVAPTVRSVAADDSHGSAYISVRGLEVLRDRAGLLAAVGEDDPAADAGTDGWAELADLARRLRSARPGMAALRNRINRVMATADRDPAAVEAAAIEGIDRALSADAEAAERAGDRVTGERVLTLSRSGTVLDALAGGDPGRVFVAESRPAGEGVDVAERLAASTAVTLHSDAAVADVLARKQVDLVLVGADTVREDGGLVNKTGTRTAAVAAAREDVPVFAVAASDKIAPGPAPFEAGVATSLYDGAADLAVYNPLFDETPPDLVAGVITEAGTLTPEAVRDLAAEHAEYADWDAD